MSQFSEGDTVRTTLASVPRGTVGFGPFRVTKDGEDHYMVQRDNGTMTPVAASAMSPYVSFAVGEEVEEKAMGRTATVEAGPFQTAGGQERYVVKLQNGNHAWVGANGLRKRQVTTWFPGAQAIGRIVEDMQRASAMFGTASRHFAYKGRTYSLDGEYADRQGDVWKFNGKTDKDGTPLLDCPLHPTFTDSRLDYVLSHYGPLSRA